MKLATTAKLPKITSAKVNDPGNPAYTEDMLGAPVLKRGRGPQMTPTNVRTSVRLKNSGQTSIRSSATNNIAANAHIHCLIASLSSLNQPTK